MDQSNHITDLIVMYTTMRSQPGVDKKAINKTIARLEEAELWSKQINNNRLNGVPGNSAAVQGDDTKRAAGCSCPSLGVVDSDCPIHK